MLNKLLIDLKFPERNEFADGYIIIVLKINLLKASNSG
jgi:hypothetical protein